MTREEKAKRYDEALEIAKKNYVTAQDLCEGSQIGVECFKNTLESIFPELNECEDERIKKNCIHFLELQKRHHAATFEIEECIAWLEKQGEKAQGKSALEAIREEKVNNQNCIKPIDKSEPNFHEGNWITNGEYTWKVISVNNFYYTLQNQLGECVEDTIEHVNNVFRLFQKNGKGGL